MVRFIGMYVIAQANALSQQLQQWQIFAPYKHSSGLAWPPSGAIIISAFLCISRAPSNVFPFVWTFYLWWHTLWQAEIIFWSVGPTFDGPLCARVVNYPRGLGTGHTNNYAHSLIAEAIEPVGSSHHNIIAPWWPSKFGQEWNFEHGRARVIHHKSHCQKLGFFHRINLN